MSVKIHLDIILRYYIINAPEIVEVNGKTVGECLNHLVKQFPAIEKQVFDKDGHIADYLSIYVNGEAAYPEELARSVKDGDELHIQHILSGG